MPRYLKQPDQYGCGPVAAVNALKHLGASIDFSRNRGLIYGWFDCLPTGRHYVSKTFNGTHPRDMEPGIREIASRYFRFSPRRVTVRTRWRRALLVEIERELQAEGVIILRLRRGAPGGGKDWEHYVAVVGQYEGGFLVCNERRLDGEMASLYACPRSDFRNLTRKRPREPREGPNTWFLRCR